jgi:hypothetical protein
VPVPEEDILDGVDCSQLSMLRALSFRGVSGSMVLPSASWQQIQPTTSGSAAVTAATRSRNVVESRLAATAATAEAPKVR